MHEWILIITMNIVTPTSGIENYQAELVTGFSSEEYCQEAAKVVGTKVSNQIVNHQAAMGISIERDTANPIVFTDCVKITK